MSIRNAMLLVTASGLTIAASWLYVDWTADNQEASRFARHQVAEWPPQHRLGSIELGDRLPEIKVTQWLESSPNLSDNKVSIDDFPGRVLLIDVWSPFCVPCHQTAGDLVKIASEFSADEIQFVGLTAVPDQAAEYLAQHSITWPNAVVARQSLDDLRRAMADDVTPDLRTSMVLLVDHQGRLLWTDNADRWRHQSQGWGDRVRTAIQRALKVTRDDNPTLSWQGDGASAP